MTQVTSYDVTELHRNDNVQYIPFGFLKPMHIKYTSRLRRLVLCILRSMFFAEEKNKNAAKNFQGSLADICDVTSRDYITVFP